MQTEATGVQPEPQKAPTSTGGPRPAHEIAQEMSPLWTKAGQLQFDIQTFQRELTQTNAKLVQLLNEANLRAMLDGQTQSSPQKTGNA